MYFYSRPRQPLRFPANWVATGFALIQFGRPSLSLVPDQSFVSGSLSKFGEALFMASTIVSSSTLETWGFWLLRHHLATDLCRLRLCAPIMQG